MRLVKALGHGAVAGMAMMALAAGTASAGVHESIGFCLQNEGLLCNPTNLVDPPAGGSLLVLAHSERGELKNSGVFSTVENCKSDAGVSVKETMNNPILGEVKELTFSECSGWCKKAESKGLPWKGELKMSSAEGTWNLFTREGGALLSECTFGTKCEYGSDPLSGTTLTGSNTASGAVLNATNVTLKYKSGSGEFVCGPTGTWNAEYRATSIHLKDGIDHDLGLHAPWWFTLLGSVDKKG
jgi:hypothetical protein